VTTFLNNQRRVRQDHRGGVPVQRHRDLAGTMPHANDRLDDTKVIFWADLVDRSGVLADLQPLWNDKGGRPNEINLRALIIAMQISASEGSCNLADIARLLATRLRHDSKVLLDLLPRAGRRVPASNPSAWEERVGRAVHALLDLMDPEAEQRGQAPRVRRGGRRAEPVTEQERAVLEQRLTTFGDKILKATWDWFVEQRPDAVAAWDGSVAHDATFIGAFSTGRNLAHEGADRAASDPQAGWYNVRGSGLTKPKRKFGYENDITMMVDVDTSAPIRFPQISLVVRTHIPGADPVGHLLQALHVLRGWQFPAGYIIADRGYTSSGVADRFGQGVVDAGYLPVMDYKKDRIGVVQAAHEGAIMVEGTWYSPCLPQALLTASRDFHDHRIDLPTYQQRLEERQHYEMRDKGRFAHGENSRKGCAAASSPNTPPKMGCDRKPNSLGPTLLGLPRVFTPPQQDTKACGQQAVTFPGNADRSLMYAQPLRYNTKPWLRVYRAGRNSMESLNQSAKFQIDLEKSNRRRVRGRAAAHVFTVLMHAAVNIRKISQWLEDAVTLPDGRVGVPRTYRVGMDAPQIRDDNAPDQASLYDEQPRPPDPNNPDDDEDLLFDEHGNIRFGDDEP
jgi:hypothetical protein